MFTPDSTTPQQRLRSAHLAGVRRIGRVRVPVYGLLPSWHGERAVGDTCFETGVTRDAVRVTAQVHESVELVHRSGASELRVSSSNHVRPIADRALLDLLGTTGTCAPMTITVDGRAVSFASAHAADRFVARWAGYRATVTAVGTRWPSATGLDLVRIIDFEPYHEGRLRMLEQRTGYGLRG